MWLLSQIAVVIVTSLNGIRLLEFRIYFVQFQIVHFRRDVHILFLYMRAVRNLVIIVCFIFISFGFSFLFKLALPRRVNLFSIILA